MVQTQWRYRTAVVGANAMGAPIMADKAVGLDYNPAIALMQHWGWDIGFGLELLQAIEIETMRMTA